MDARIKLSKKMSYLLRHSPEDLDLTIDSEGWVPFPEFSQKLGARGFTEDAIRNVIRLCQKQRFALKTENGIEYIRANQGHTSDEIKVTFQPVVPEHSLYHGTTYERLQKITDSGGLKPMARHHVHLSKDQITAENVARRWKNETPVILKVDARRMVKNGFKFYLSDNGVWLTDSVPIEYVNYRSP